MQTGLKNSSKRLFSRVCRGPEPTLSDPVSLALVNREHAGIQAGGFGSAAACSFRCCDGENKTKSGELRACQARWRMRRMDVPAWVSWCVSLRIQSALVSPVTKQSGTNDVHSLRL